MTEREVSLKQWLEKIGRVFRAESEDTSPGIFGRGF